LGRRVVWVVWRGDLLDHIEVDSRTRNIFCIEFTAGCFQYSMPPIDVLLGLLVKVSIGDIGILSDKQVDVVNECFECKLY